MHKIAFLTDIHANLPALECVLDKIHEDAVDEIIIGGDCIGIGPYPAETLSRIMTLQNCSFINGNHEIVSIIGPNKIAKDIIGEEGYFEHANWCTNQLNSTMIEYLKSKPLNLMKEIEGVLCHFLHYPFDQNAGNSEYTFIHVERDEKKLMDAFSNFSGKLICYGHDHPGNLIVDTRTYLNPGSLGCFNKPIARFAVIEIHQGDFTHKNYAIQYDDTDLFDKFEERNVPDREFIYKAFFGSRFEIK